VLSRLLPKLCLGSSVSGCSGSSTARNTLAGVTLTKPFSSLTLTTNKLEPFSRGKYLQPSLVFDSKASAFENGAQGLFVGP
jgi:hypothetical protein